MSGGFRVAQVVRSDAFAGVERYLATVSAELVGRGIEVTVIGGDPARMEAAFGGVPVRHVPAASTLDVARALRSAGRFDIVHAHMTVAELAAVATRRRHRGVLVCTRHFAAPRGLPRPVDRWLSARFTAQIAISDHVAARCAGSTVTIPNGVPASEAVASTGTRVVVIQRLEAEKHTADALRGWAVSGLGARGWRLTIAGDGAERASLEGLATELGISGTVEFLGHCPDPHPLRAEAAFQLAPQPDDGFGLSVAEAMAAGLPVLAADGGGHRELLADFPELRYAPGDPAALGRALAALAGRPDRAVIGARLRAVQQQRFSIGAHVDALLGLYRTVRP